MKKNNFKKTMFLRLDFSLKHGFMLVKKKIYILLIFDIIIVF